MSFVLILFLDAGYRMLKNSTEDHNNVRVDTDALLHSKIFYAQRNFYMTGFTILLNIVINRVQHLITSLDTLQLDYNRVMNDYAELIQSDNRFKVKEEATEKAKKRK